MSKLDPHILLLLAAGRFCVKPGPATHAELAAAAPPARDVYDVIPPLYQQLVAAAERIASAPPAAWTLARDGLSELIQSMPLQDPEPAPQAAPPHTVRSQPIICPHCGEPSASPFVCDICNEAIQQDGEAA